MTINNFPSLENCQVVPDFFFFHPCFSSGKYFQYAQIRCNASLTAELVPFGIWLCTPTHTSLTADPLVCFRSSLLACKVSSVPFELEPVVQDQMLSSLTSLYRDFIPSLMELLSIQRFLKPIPALSSVLYQRLWIALEQYIL